MGLRNTNFTFVKMKIVFYAVRTLQNFYFLFSSYFLHVQKMIAGLSLRKAILVVDFWVVNIILP